MGIMIFHGARKLQREGKLEDLIGLDQKSIKVYNQI